MDALDQLSCQMTLASRSFLEGKLGSSRNKSGPIFGRPAGVGSIDTLATDLSGDLLVHRQLLP